MKLTLRCYVDGIQFNGGSSIQIPEPFVEHFEPLRVSDDPMLAYLEYGKTPASAKFEHRVKLREDAAKILAEQLAALIIEQMQALDTVNGYQKDRGLIQGN